jgi:D-alanine-D-alanine ligase
VTQSSSRRALGPTRFKKWLKSRRIAVLLGGPSAEREISLKTGRAILQSLKRQKFNAVGIDPKADLAVVLKRKAINFVFLALHGEGGEDGVIQGFLEWMKIPYTGSGVLASAAAMDKVHCKQLFRSAGLPTAPWFEVTKENRKGSLALARRLGFPLVVKPATQGSAIGVSIVRAAAQWERALNVGFRYGPVQLIESYLSGPEVTVGVLGDRVLPVIQIIPSDGPFYDFHAKYAPGGSKHLLPARIPDKDSRLASELALKVCRLLNIRGAARVDLIVDLKRGPQLLEVNTIPGMTETSLLPEAARAAGIDFDELVLKIAELSYGA